jgi:hypothetical protein
MVIVDAPIRVLGNQVTLHTAAAVQEFFDLCQAADPKSGYVALPPYIQQKVVSINKQMGIVVDTQQALLAELEKVNGEHLATAGFDKVIGDLERVVAQGDSAISDAYAAPTEFVKLWRKNLELMAEHNSHIDSYVESFRIALDENCSALLAELATQVIEGR